MTSSQCASNIRSDPDGDLIEQIIIGGRQFWILENVVRSGILDDLENEAAPISVSSFCEKYNYHDGITVRILNLMVSMGIVNKTIINDVWRYSNTSTTSKYLTKASPFDRSCAVIGERSYVETSMAKLPLALKNGTFESATELFSDTDQSPPARDLSGKENSNMRNLNIVRDKVNNNELKKSADKSIPKSAEIANRTYEVCPQTLIKIMDSMIYSTQHIIPRVFDLSGHRKAVDLGGGSGFTAKLFIAHYPQLSVQVLELPHVVNMVREQYENCATRMSFVAGDFFKDDLPTADLYILAHILHSWSEAQIHVLLNKIFRSLPPGGELLILEKFLHKEKTGPTLALTMDIMMAMIGEGRERTAMEYSELLQDHGFVNTRTRLIEGINIYDAILTAKPT